MITWVEGANGNRASLEYWGSEEAARNSLDTLTGCSRCSNCSGCTDCSRCSGCLNCSRCSGCSDCSGISREPIIVPTIENIHAVVYAAAASPGALDMGTWHTCKNTHCRAGWVVALAGDAGRALESFYDTSLAAMMIYDASAPGFKINPSRFFDGNEAALADMKRMAEEAVP